MGVKKEGVADGLFPSSVISQCTKSLDPLAASNEKDLKMDIHESVKYSNLSSASLNKCLPKRSVAIRDFSKTYQADDRYRGLVQAHLRRIIERNVTAVSLNPVFGSLWRTVCNDRQNEGRQGLLDLFGKNVDDIKDDASRVKMKLWLEERR
jgi:hypothetical protein